LTIFRAIHRIIKGKPASSGMEKVVNVAIESIYSIDPSICVQVLSILAHFCDEGGEEMQELFGKLTRDGDARVRCVCFLFVSLFFL